MRVLIVDDEKDICRMICRIVSRRHIECNFAHNLEDARKLINTEKPELYFLDISLPDGRGFDLIPQMNNVTPDAKIVMISAYDDEHERNQAEYYNVKDFISKPFSKKNILDSIKITN